MPPPARPDEYMNIESEGAPRQFDEPVIIQVFWIAHLLCNYQSVSPDNFQFIHLSPPEQSCKQRMPPPA